MSGSDWVMSVWKFVPYLSLITKSVNSGGGAMARALGSSKGSGRNKDKEVQTRNRTWCE